MPANVELSTCAGANGDRAAARTAGHHWSQEGNTQDILVLAWTPLAKEHSGHPGPGKDTIGRIRGYLPANVFTEVTQLWCPYSGDRIAKGPLQIANTCVSLSSVPTAIFEIHLFQKREELLYTNRRTHSYVSLKSVVL